MGKYKSIYAGAGMKRDDTLDIRRRLQANCEAGEVLYGWRDSDITLLLAEIDRREQAAHNYDEDQAATVRWLRQAGFPSGANALAELHVNGRALRGLEPLVHVHGSRWSGE